MRHGETDIKAWIGEISTYEVMFGDDVLVESKEPKLKKDKKIKEFKNYGQTRYERRKNYAKADENVEDKKKKEH